VVIFRQLGFSRRRLIGPIKAGPSLRPSPGCMALLSREQGSAPRGQRRRRRLRQRSRKTLWGKRGKRRARHRAGAPILRPNAGDALCAAMSDASPGKHQEALRRAVAHINPAQFLRFAAVGAIATIIQFSILVALVELAHVNELIANAIGFIFAASANYLMN